MVHGGVGNFFIFFIFQPFKKFHWVEGEEIKLIIKETQMRRM